MLGKVVVVIQMSSMYLEVDMVISESDDQYLIREDPLKCVLSDEAKFGGFMLT